MDFSKLANMSETKGEHTGAPLSHSLTMVLV